MAGTFTAWLTTEGPFLDGQLCDVTVLPTDSNGISTENPAAIVKTDVDFDDDEAMEGILEAARRALHDAGWAVISEWTAVPSGYTATVANA